MAIQKMVTNAVIMNAVAANGVGSAMEAAAYRFISLQIATTGTAAGVLKVQASLNEVKPDFSSAATAANPWFYMHTFNLVTGASVAGATGVTYSGTDAVTPLGIDLNNGGVNWVDVELSGFSAGTFTIKALGLGNQ